MWTLAKLLAVLTGHERYFPEIIWSDSSWAHNVFRAFEMIFGRRYGIRAEMSAWKENGKQRYACHSWESVFALTETYIREYFASFKFVPFRIYIPMLQTIQGQRVPASPYLFAIALDVGTAGALDATTTTITWNHTCTGSDLLLLMNSYQDDTNSWSSFTYNSIGGTQVQTPAGQAATWWCSMWRLAGPATGSNAILGTGTNTKHKGGASVSYTGVDQTSPIDSSNKGNNASASTFSVTTTVVGSNCWLVGVFESGGTFNAGTGTTERTRAPSDEAFSCDSNGTVATGGQALEGTNAGSGWGGIVASIAPSATVTTARDARELTLLGVG